MMRHRNTSTRKVERAFGVFQYNRTRENLSAIRGFGRVWTRKRVGRLRAADGRRARPDQRLNLNVSEAERDRATAAVNFAVTGAGS